MKIVYRCVVKNGTYTAADGTEKTRWVNVGRVGKNEHGAFLLLDAHINLAAFPRQGDQVLVSLFEPDKDDSLSRRTQNKPSPSPEFNEDIPF